LPWFRFRRRKDEQQAADAAVTTFEAPAPAEQQAAPADDTSTTDGEAAKKFYGELFGWEPVDNPMGPDAVYEQGLRAAVQLLRG